MLMKKQMSKRINSKANISDKIKFMIRKPEDRNDEISRRSESTAKPRPNPLAVLT